MRVAVYTIALNEAQEVAGWLKATAGADYRLVVDTGSSDDTMKLLREGGAHVSSATVRPWRFDDAFNIALGLLPADVDVCFRVDMDERPRPGWRAVIDREWTEGLCTLRYPYWWSRELSFYTDKVHARHGFRYRGATHEGLCWRGDGQQTDKFTDDLVVDHFSKESKPRPGDLSILEEALREDPNDARMILHYGRELMRWERNEEAAAQIRRFLDLTGEDGIDASFCWRQLAYCEPEKRFEHLLRADQACSCASTQLALAEYYRDTEKWKECYSAAQHAIAFIRMTAGHGAGHWSDDIRLRGPLPHDLATVAGFNMWDFEAGYGHAVEAVRRDPSRDPTRMQNLKTLQEMIKSGATQTDLPKRKIMIEHHVRPQITREPQLAAE